MDTVVVLCPLFCFVVKNSIYVVIFMRVIIFMRVSVRLFGVCYVYVSTLDLRVVCVSVLFFLCDLRDLDHALFHFF